MSRDVRLTIEGMHCGACVRRVTAALEKVPGLQVEAVHIGSAEAKAQNDLAADAALAAIHKAGFQAALET